MGTFAILQMKGVSPNSVWNSFTSLRKDCSYYRKVDKSKSKEPVIHRRKIEMAISMKKL